MSMEFHVDRPDRPAHAILMDPSTSLGHGETIVHAIGGEVDHVGAGALEADAVPAAIERLDALIEKDNDPLLPELRSVLEEAREHNVGIYWG